MRFWVLLALLAALAFVLARWAVTRRPHWISLTLLLLLLLPLGFLEVRWRAMDNAVSAVTRALVPGSQGSACQRWLGTWAYAGAEWGHVEFDATGRADTMAWLSYAACSRLKDFYWSDKRNPTLDQVQAVHVIAHEAMHLRGERSEATAECDAVQETEETARLLGASPERARSIAVIYWEAAYDMQPPGYRTEDCREDGPLDRTPGDGHWP